MSTEGSDNSTPEVELDEVAALKAERDALAAELETTKKKRRGGRGRRVFVAVLVLLSCLMFTVAVPATWTRRTLSNTDNYVATVGPIIEHDSVTDALSLKISAEIITLLDVDSIAATALPPRAALLAGPITGAVEDFVVDRVNEVISSDRFAEFWVNANRFVHTQIQAVIRGQVGAAVTTEDGQIVLNLLPIINEVLVRIEERGGDLLGKDVDLPEISDGEVPEEARAKLETALGVTIPPDLGQIVIYESDKLEAVQDAAKTAHKVVFLVVGLALLLAIAALAISKSRRRTLLQLSAGMLVGLVLIRRSLMYAQDQIVDLAKPENRDAMEAIVDDLMAGLFSYTRWIMIVLLSIMVIALVTGPYGWAVSLRRRSAALYSATVSSAQGASKDEATVAWVRAHYDALRFGGVIVAVLLLLLFDVSWVVFFILVGLVVLYELALTRFADDSAEAPAEPV